MRSTFKVLFYLKRTKSTPRAVYPVMGRITVNGTISQFSAKINVPEQLWEVKGGRAKGKSVESERINRHLDNIRIQIGKHYQSICDHDAYVTAEKVKNAWLGMGERYRTLVDVFEHYTNDLFKRIGVDRSESTWWRYRAVAGSSPGLSETRVQPPRYSAARIGTVVHRAIPRLFENCLPFEGGQRMPLHRLFEATW